MSDATVARAPLQRGAHDHIPEPQWLPSWRPEVRGAPKALLRSALFSCADKRKARRIFECELVGSVAGQQITYTGTELRQDDLTVWLHAVHLMRVQPLGQSVEVTPLHLLEGLGWCPNAEGYQHLRQSIERLSNAFLTLDRPNRERFSGKLLTCIAEASSGNRQRLKLSADPELAELFTKGWVAHLDPEERRILSPLAQWLYGFYSTLDDPYPYKAVTLQALCGSTAKNPGGFKRNLIEALDQMKEKQLIVGYLADGPFVRPLLSLRPVVSAQD